jgi:hypothetical protein
MEREPPQNFDVLAVDAFSGDAIPDAPHHGGSVRHIPAPHETRRA